MKPISKALALLLLLGVPVMAGAAMDPSVLFSTVAPGDSTYARLKNLEKVGWLPAGASQGPLTRYEVTQDILEAQKNSRGMVVAQVDADMLPSADDLSAAPASDAAVSETPSAPAPSDAASATESDADLQKAAESLTSLQDAYQYELKSVQDQESAADKAMDAVEASQYGIWKRLKGISEYPNVAWHGLGRAFEMNQQYYGDTAAIGLTHNSTQTESGYLDFNPEGVVDKEIRFNAILRYKSQIESNQSAAIDLLTIRRVTMDYNAPWLSATLGDFDESYTPLTLWNRDNLDLRYKPEMIAREDDTLKYESFLNHEPDWPFRGARVGTELLWPNSQVLDRLQISVMADMIRNGFNDTSGQAFYYGPSDFTDVIFGGKGKLQSKRWYMGGGTSFQATLNAYAVILAQPLGTDTPNSIYVKFNPDTWAHHYQTISVKPSVDFGLGDDTSFGGAWEGASAVYQDDEQDNGKVISDYAIMAGPYFRFGHSKLTFNYLYVGPDYYSPLAQTRQDDITPGAAESGPATPELFTAPLRSQFFLNDIPRAGGIFSFYDRTQDNTFPYGMATPNRQGAGLDLDVKTLEKDALKIAGSIYFVQEVRDNLVVNSTGTNDDAVVDGSPSAPTPQRSFTYVNLGPSLNLAPFLGLSQDLIVGTNVRFEQTNSSIGTLTSAWVLGGVQVGILPWWELAASYSDQEINGSEAGYAGTTLARYSYIFDNSDLGEYQVFNINGSNQSFRLSSVFKINRNSNLDLDYDLTSGNAIPYSGVVAPTGRLSNQYLEMTYEIQF
ncbi:MAG: hypothetical protein ACREL1_02420 [bacterium]